MDKRLEELRAKERLEQARVDVCLVAFEEAREAFDLACSAHSRAEDELMYALNQWREA
jgi:hypothetical protein